MSTAPLLPPSGGATRRQFLAGSLTLAALLAGCGQGSGASSGGGGEGAAEGFPVRIEHKYGTAEITAPPERVVTVGLTEQDYVLALEGTLVGAREWFGEHPGALWPWATDRLGDRPLPEVLPRDQLNFEQLAALEPDLVLGVNSGLTREEYDTLAGIATTVAQPKRYADYGAPWQEITRVVGRALGRSGRAEQLVKDLEGRFEQARADHPELDGATGILATSISGTAYVYAEGPAPRFLTTLGLELPPEVEGLFTGDNREPVQLSLEQLRLLEADVVVMGIYGDRGTSVAANPLYRRLTVSREGRDLLLPEMSLANGALSFSTVLSLPIALDQVVPALAAAIDGDPTTKTTVPA